MPGPTRGTHAKIVTAVLAAVAATIHLAVAQERTIERRSPACVVQKDLDAFYDLMRNQPSMQDLADFLRAHQCISLKSGDRVTVDREDPDGLYYCVRMRAQNPCYWVPRNALKR